MAPAPSFWRVFLRRYLVALGVAFVLAFGGLVALNLVVDSTLDDITTIGGLRLAEAGPADAGNYLVIGSDSREFVENQTEVDAFGDPTEQVGRRSDTMMVVHVDPEADRSLLVSFPRDLIVDIPGEGRGQINSAYNIGGENLVIATLKENFNIDIQHYVEVDFAAFVGIVDAVGKIPVYFPAPSRDRYSGLNVPYAPGCVELDGNQALQYVRARYLEVYDAAEGEWEDASGRSDLDRIGRQQTFIRRLANVASEKASGNPLKAKAIAEAIVPKLRIDDQLGKSEIFRLVNEFRNVDPDDEGSIEMLTLPVEAASDGARLVPKEPEAEQVLARLRTFGAPTDTAASRVLRSQVRLRVLNGSGVSGQAGSTLANLQQYGFQPAGTGNASSRSATEVRYRPDAKDAQEKAELVQSFLGGTGEIIADDKIVDADVVIVTGADFEGVTPPPGVVASSSTSSSSTTTAPRRSQQGDAAPPPVPAC